MTQSFKVTDGQCTLSHHRSRAWSNCCFFPIPKYWTCTLPDLPQLFRSTKFSFCRGAEQFLLPITIARFAEWGQANQLQERSMHLNSEARFSLNNAITLLLLSRRSFSFLLGRIAALVASYLRISLEWCKCRLWLTRANIIASVATSFAWIHQWFQIVILTTRLRFSKAAHY